MFVYMYVFVFAHMHVCARTLFRLKQVKKMAFICPLFVRRGYSVCMAILCMFASIPRVSMCSGGLLTC